MFSKEGFSSKIIFSDEAHFYLNGHVNKQNCRIQGTEYPYMIHEKCHSMPKRSLFGAAYGLAESLDYFSRKMNVKRPLQCHNGADSIRILHFSNISCHVYTFYGVFKARQNDLNNNTLL